MVWYVVTNDDDDNLGKFKTIKEAKVRIKELKEFDKQEGNPFEEHYRIERQVY
jgi:hypothetical protein